MNSEPMGENGWIHTRDAMISYSDTRINPKIWLDLARRTKPRPVNEHLKSSL